MSHTVKQPVGQKRLTNIAIVKYKSHGKRFEIACFRNKVKDWRDGKEKDINEVLQTTTIFSNVGKGVVFKAKDLEKVFGDKSEEDICRIILEKGELQVSDKEREQHLEELFRDVATLCAERLIHASTGRALTVQMVSDALRSTHFAVTNSATDSAKKQSLRAIEHLTMKMPGSFVRANMRLCVVVPDSAKEELDVKLAEICTPLVIKSGELDAQNASYSVTFDCAPHCYRPLDQLITKIGTHARMIVIESCVVENKDGAELPGLEEPAKQPKKDGVVEKSSDCAPASDESAAGGVAAQAASGPAAPFCSTCQQSLTEDFRSHCKSKLHSFNVKRKVKGLPPLTEEALNEAELDEDFVANFRGVE